MEINFKQAEITKALEQYVARRFNTSGQSFKADFRMGKGGNGLTVKVTIDEAEGHEPTAADTNAAETARPGTVGASIAETVATTVGKQTTSKNDSAAQGVNQAPALTTTASTNGPKGKGEGVVADAAAAVPGATPAEAVKPVVADAVVAQEADKFLPEATAPEVAEAGIFD